MLTNRQEQFIQAARLVALSAHESCNQKYDKYLPYEFHLRQAVLVASHHIGLIPPYQRHIVIGAVWGHDVLEDTHLSYNDIRKEMSNFYFFENEKDNADLAMMLEIIYAVTNEKGRVRSEKANDKYYEGIRNQQFAPFVKLCDRIANLRYGKLTASQQLQMYKKENPHFEQMLICEEIKKYGAMFVEIRKLLGIYEH